MTTFFTSDTHYSHTNVIKYSKRPYRDKDEMNEALIAGWNRKVRPTDTVFHLGDVAFCQEAELQKIFDRLNGEIILLWGNHDRQIQKSAKLKSRFKFTAHYYELNEPDHTCDRGSQSIVLCHYPMMSWNKAHHGAWMLHGHCHGNLKYPINAKILDVGVDPMDYEPRSYSEIKTMMAKKGTDSLDHHKSKM